MTGGPVAVDLAARLDRPVFDQGLHPLCTATVTTTLAQYWAARVGGVSFRPSVLFNYRMSRRLAGRPDRRGSTLGDAFAAWRRFGMLDETLWPYRPELIDADPPAALFAAARFHQVRYERLDGPDLPAEDLLGQVRECLAGEMPVSVEFPLGPSILSSLSDGVVVPPPADEAVIGRHVVVVVGYDDAFATGGGALRFRNNWGDGWGDGGYGWLPYEFLQRGMARHAWVVRGVNP